MEIEFYVELTAEWTIKATLKEHTIGTIYKITDLREIIPCSGILSWSNIIYAIHKGGYNYPHIRGHYNRYFKFTTKEKYEEQKNITTDDYIIF